MIITIFLLSFLKAGSCSSWIFVGGYKGVQGKEGLNTLHYIRLGQKL